jgi:hypothetical protein
LCPLPSFPFLSLPFDMRHPEHTIASQRTVDTQPFSRLNASPRISRSRGPDALWARHSRELSPYRCLCGQDPEGRSASRPAGGTADEIRVGHQPEDGQGARDDDAPGYPLSGGRGDSLRPPSDARDGRESRAEPSPMIKGTDDHLV